MYISAAFDTIVHIIFVRPFAEVGRCHRVSAQVVKIQAEKSVKRNFFISSVKLLGSFRVEFFFLYSHMVI